MSNVNDMGSGTGGQSSRFSGVAKEGADMIRRVFSVAAREELESVREETMAKVAPTAQSVGFLAAGGVLAAYGATYVLHGVYQGLATWMPRWLASLLTGVMLLAGAGVLVQRGRQQLKPSDTAAEETSPV